MADRLTQIFARLRDKAILDPDFNRRLKWFYFKSGIIMAVILYLVATGITDIIKMVAR